VAFLASWQVPIAKLNVFVIQRSGCMTNHLTAVPRVPRLPAQTGPPENGTQTQHWGRLTRLQVRDRFSV
jgi:hypothetical protein